MEEEDRSKLDVQNQNFDPLLALYSKETRVPQPEAPVLDNVARCEHLLTQCDGPTVKITDVIKRVHESRKKAMENKTLKVEIPPAPGPSGEKDTKRQVQNVLTRMENATGPLGFLRHCMEKDIRIKVWTRNATSIRGYYIGFLKSFDKHWNLAMTDVVEVWSRKAKRKTISSVNEHRIPKSWEFAGTIVKPPKVVVVKTAKGMETCERHIQQIMIRGEHIAIISMSDT